MLTPTVVTSRILACLQATPTAQVKVLLLHAHYLSEWTMCG
jgi:hypothetical protein